MARRKFHPTTAPYFMGNACFNREIVYYCIPGKEMEVIFELALANHNPHTECEAWGKSLRQIPSRTLARNIMKKLCFSDDFIDKAYRHFAFGVLGAMPKCWTETVGGMRSAILKIAELVDKGYEATGPGVLSPKKDGE